MKRAGKYSRAILIVILIISIVLVSLISLKFTGYAIQNPIKQVKFNFHDENANCSLDGYVFIGDKLIGKSVEGQFNLSQKNYEDNFNNSQKNNNEISIFGKLGDCFNEDKDLFFDKYWQSFEIKNYYFSGESNFDFKTSLDSHNPSKRELMGFIQPETVKSVLNFININEPSDIFISISKINSYLNAKVKYKQDWEFNKNTNYWQTPEETLKINQGDCEDYSVALLSLILAYNNSLNCYNIVFTSHVTTFCFNDNYYAYYDQGKTELKMQLDNKQNSEQVKFELAKLNEDYFKHYGINNATETKSHFAFSNNRYVEFNTNEDFINWQYNLQNQKTEQNIFKNLEQKAEEITRFYNEQSAQEPQGELATQQVLSTQTLNISPIWIIFLSVTLVILIALLIIINRKRK
jgi:hypothetical protein